MKSFLQILALLSLLSGCGDGQNCNESIHIPEESYLIGLLKKDSDEISLSHFWTDGEAIRIRPCMVRARFAFNWNDYRKHGFVQRISCGPSYDIDAVVSDKNHKEGISPSYEGLVLLKTHHDFKYPRKYVEEKMAADRSGGVVEFVHKLEKEEKKK
ncbi:MAG: hypothetical protein H6618_05115 [Deltaproteobacteria bacterium]|nr:hypothetical protein [Deltaproteobacteria bacterium]